MPELTPTRAAALELHDERRAMHEGHTFLDEKCLLLASEILAELHRYARVEAALDTAHDAAVTALRDAVARHGLGGLEIYPAPEAAPGEIARQSRALMGVQLQSATLTAPNAVAATSVARSPEASACGSAFADVLARATELAAMSGNLMRLHREYERSVRRARALQDVLLPELDRTLRDMETRLEELEQEDAIRMHGR